jgi:hypothetical protein
MMKFKFSITLILFFPSALFGQAAGSREAYEIIANAQTQARLEAGEWQAVKKLSIIEKVPALPTPTRSTSLPPENFGVGKVANVRYWDTKVFQIVDSDSMIVRMANKYVWVDGYSTKNLVDDQKIRIVDYLEIMGTKSFNTVQGSKSTVWHLRPLEENENKALIDRDIKSHAEEVRQEEVEKLAAKEREDAYVKLEFEQRTFGKETSVTGKLLSLTRTTATLQKTDGSIVKIPLKAFTNEARLQLKQLANAQRKAKRLATKKHATPQKK